MYPSTPNMLGHLRCTASEENKTLIRIFIQWISEVLHFCQGLPIILVGCKKDLRYDQKTIEELHKTSQKPVTPEQVSLNSPQRNTLGSILHLDLTHSLLLESVVGIIHKRHRD